MSIIIPMLVETYLSDGIDVETKRVPQTAPDYSAALYPSFLGSRNTPAPVDDKMPPLKRGVHLHFILPDAFKKGNDEGIFPEVPDRYLVTRFLTDGDAPQVRQWMVESSFISTDERYAKSVAIPMFQDEEVKFRYCGRAYDIRKKPEQEAEYLDSLSAVGGGDPFFAAYYPGCHSIFGFRDDMEGVAEGAKVSYFVTGYFAKEGKDPFYRVKDREELTELLEERKLSVEDVGKIGSRCLLFGIAEGIVWTNGTIADKIPSGNIDVALGRTSAEALSAVAEKLTASKEPEFQKLFNALQYGEADRISEIDGAYQIEDGIVLRQYQRLDGENGSYALNGSDEENSNAAERFAEIQKEKQKLGYAIGECKSERAKLSVLWEQYMLLYEDNSVQIRGSNVPSKEEMLAEIRQVAERIREREDNIDKSKKWLDSRVTEIMDKTGDVPYYVPKEPALLLCGDGVKRSYAFGENGRYTGDGMLECQTETISCNVGKEEILSCFVCEETELGETYRSLVLQAVLLIKETKDYLESKYGSLSVRGRVSPIALNDKPGDFVTLFMDWQLLFYPVRTSGDTQKDDTLSHCSFSYGRTGFSAREAIGSRCMTYTGRSVLTPHVSINLKQRFRKWMDVHGGDADMERAAELLDTLPVISQNLGGLNDQMKGMMQAFEFPVMGNGGDEREAAAVAAYAASFGRSVLAGYPLLPLGGGYFRVSLIQIVGTFGQIQQVYVPAADRIPDTVYSETLESGVRGFGFLSPGFLTPSRVMLRWLWREGIYSSSAKETTPVAGFFVPNLLNCRLTVYSAEGRALGEIKTVKRNGKSAVRWLSAPGLPTELEKVEMCEELKRFITVMTGKDKAFPEVMKVVEEVLEKTVSDSASGKIWGKTLALSKAEAALEFYGEPEFVKSFPEFGTYNTLGTEEIRIPLALGDIGRVLDGFVGAFSSDAFERMYPPFGMEGGDGSGYVRYGELLSLSGEDGRTPLYLLAEVSAGITVQTGLHPPGSLKLFPAHQEAAGELMLLAELNPILTQKGKAELPFAAHMVSGEEKKLLFQLVQKDEAVYWETEMPGAFLQDTVICDGRAALLNVCVRKEGE